MSTNNYDNRSQPNACNGTSEKITIALFGCGRIGTVHLKSIVRHPKVRLKWIVEEDADLAARVLDDVGLDDVLVVNFKNVGEVYQDQRFGICIE